MFFTCLFQAIPPTQTRPAPTASAPRPSAALARPVRQAPPRRPAPVSTPAGAVASLGSGWATPPRDGSASREELEMRPLTPRLTSTPQAETPDTQDIVERAPQRDRETGLVLPSPQDAALQELGRPSPIDWEKESV